jgi:hypothetical protein
MIVEISSGKGGFKLYLEHGQKKGRDQHRDQLDQRIALAGDLDVFEMATSVGDADGYKYDHITLSFSEDHVSDEVLQLAVAEFREHALAAWPQEDRHRIAFYAEAHRPRMTSYANSETGVKVERLTHIHIGLGKHDLLTGKPVAPLGFLGHPSDKLKYIDAWQESFNARQGLSSPKDNPKIAPEDAVDILARYTGHRPDALGTFNQQKSAFELTLQKEIIAQNITTWEGLGKLLCAYGAVSKMRADLFNECYRIKLGGAHRAMRLQGVFFQRQFIERPTVEKIEILTRKAKAAYLEQMQPRKTPEYLAKTLTQWHGTKARELRYLHTGSTFFRDVYLPADIPTRIEILNKLERQAHGVPRSTHHPHRALTPTRNRVPGMPIRDLDAIQGRSEMLLRGDTGVDVRASAGKESMGLGLRPADGGRGGRSAANRHGGNLTDPTGGLTQPSSVLARVQADRRERYAQAADKDKYAEIRQNIDCAQLLNRLSHSHGINAARYQAATAKDGTPRIQCGSRALSPSDFLLKELGLAWREAAPILRTTYEHQMGKLVTPARTASTSNSLWLEFKAARLAEKPAIAARLQAFDAETGALRHALAVRLKQDSTQALTGLSGASRKATQSLQKLAVATVKAEFNDERRARRKTIQPLQAQGWKLFLHALAQAGREEALAALRKLDDTARAAPAQSITGTIHLDDEDDKKRRRARKADSAFVLKALMYVIATNGDITYSRHGHAVLRDEGRHLAVLDPNDKDAIEAALLLGLEKFGATLALTGSPEFQQRVVAVAVAKGIPVRFVDPQLEALRVRFVDEKRQAGVIQHPPAQRKELAPVVPDLPAQATAAEWIASQSKTAVRPYAQDGSSVQYTARYFAADGVVVDHGRGRLAIYPLPDGISMQAGDRVIVGRDGRLALPATPDPSEKRAVER